MNVGADPIMGAASFAGKKALPMIRKATIFVAAIAASLASAAPVTAADNMFEPTTRIVRYDDLDLTVRMAVNSACGHWDARSLSEKAMVDKCRKAARQQSEAQVAEALRNAAVRLASRAN
jgi:UrcA family protein